MHRKVSVLIASPIKPVVLTRTEVDSLIKKKRKLFNLLVKKTFTELHRQQDLKERLGKIDPTRNINIQIELLVPKDRTKMKQSLSVMESVKTQHPRDQNKHMRTSLTSGLAEGQRCPKKSIY